MYYGKIRDCDIANGKGVRVSLLCLVVEIIAKIAFNLKHGILTMGLHIQKKPKSTLSSYYQSRIFKV